MEQVVARLRVSFLRYRAGKLAAQAGDLRFEVSEMTPRSVSGRTTFRGECR